jgi:hypothetical protein
LKNIISSLLSQAAASLNNISNNLAPIPSVKYLHDRNERKRVREVVDESNSRMSPELQLVSNYVLQEERKMKGVANSITPPKKRTKTNVNITPPSNGVQYRKSEVLNELRKYKKGSKDICKAMNDMINMGYVPCGVHTLRRMMALDAEGKPTPDTPWSTTKGIFAVLNNAQLQEFIFARDSNYRTKASLPAKGTLEEAKTNTDPTKRKCIQVAFDCRLLPNLIEGNQPHDLSQAVDDEQIRRMHVQRIILNEDQTILPSTLLSHESWVKYAVDLLALDKTSSTLTDVTSFDKEKADHLLRKLEVRYKLHVNMRINNASKCNHWVLKLACKNLPVVAACMILSHHVAMDVKCLGRLTCLLAPNANTFIPCADNSSMNCQGAYLYFDNNRGTFIRSGKVVRRGFVDRHKEHMAESKKDKPESEFYLLYPSKHGRRCNRRELLGHFENLMQVVAAGFDASSEPAMFMNKNSKQGGLLIMNNDDLCRIESVLKTKHLSQLQKCQEFIAYLFEFVYNLAINPDINVSRSPGFESFMCIYGGSGV